MLLRELVAQPVAQLGEAAGLVRDHRHEHDGGDRERDQRVQPAIAYAPGEPLREPEAADWGGESTVARMLRDL